jgi:hypothetical protein
LAAHAKTDKVIRRLEDMPEGHAEQFAQTFHAALKRGVYFCAERLRSKFYVARALPTKCWSERARRFWRRFKKQHEFDLLITMKPGRDRIKILLVGVWVTFTVTLAVWWLIFGLRQLDLLSQFHVEQSDQLQRHYQMLLWEGGILIASLVGGGLALFYYARREQKRHPASRGILCRVHA